MERTPVSGLAGNSPLRRGVGVGEGGYAPGPPPWPVKTTTTPVSGMVPAGPMGRLTAPVSALSPSGGASGVFCEWGEREQHEIE